MGWLVPESEIRGEADVGRSEDALEVGHAVLVGVPEPAPGAMCRCQHAVVLPWEALRYDIAHRRLLPLVGGKASGGLGGCLPHEAVHLHRGVLRVGKNME